MASNLTPRPFEIVPIEDEMRRSYLDYAMSVIVSRALPDVRDGLKPVQRRILYAMREGGYGSDRPHRKSAKMVGEVMGNFHPHGDSAIYDAMVRMAQDFTMRLPLIDGQGNFGSMDDDPPAAMRYTEARLARAADALLQDIDKDTVDFRANYDESTVEPVVLPAQYPNLLVNGAGGIAVGMATNIPPHNLGELIDACIALLQNPQIDTSELLEIVKGPDFPTGAIILGRAGIQQAYTTGRGSVIVRSRTHFEQVRDRQAIIVTEVPYQVNKARMVERIAEVVREKRVEGIADLRDESDRHGVRVVIEVKRDADPEVVLNQLFKFTSLQTSWGINMVALVGGRPQIVTLRDILEAFLEFREEVIIRRTAFDLGKARDRAHVLVGLAAAVADIDAVISLVRAAPNPQAAREELMARAWPTEQIAPFLELIEPEEGTERQDASTFRLSERQARAILDLQLQRLTGLEREKITGELGEIALRIHELLKILRSRERLLEVTTQELLDVRERFANERRTEIDIHSEPDMDIEDLIQREDMVVTVTVNGYIKRVPLTTFRAQRRGGKGRAGMRTHDDDIVGNLFVANTHTPMLFFSSLGRVYKLKVYKLPLGTPQARGKAMINLFAALEKNESITAVMPLPEDETSWAEMSVFFATARGKVRRNALADFVRVPSNGKIAMGLDGDDKLVGAEVCDDSHDILLAAAGGKAIRFPASSVRVFRSRSSEGVWGMDLADGDRVISMSILDHIELSTEQRDEVLRWANARRRQLNNGLSNGEEGESAEPVETAFEPQFLSREELDAYVDREQLVLTVTANGFGKRTSAFEYRVTRRGGQGIINIETSARNGGVTAAFPVANGDQLMLVTDRGKTIRMPVKDIRIAGRNTQGVKLFTTDGAEQVVSAAHLPETEGESVDEVADEEILDGEEPTTSSADDPA
ncbi:DNA gyrase subunit A [Arboricoccus pini]|uniref:DNA gyrase subunit A n=1 Tax=Arboricoccus pini TaxID=1963835 RepID=A0A212R692_9PROT|nr:DNA gyrase subunit A [Arboricoccus pini]SNB67665.1 DNA gyrase subunit A [Arboricoccus pini]